MGDLKGVVRGSVALLALVFASGVAFGDTVPGARVARLTYTEGYVHVDRAENIANNTPGDPAQLNMPLVEGQTVITGDNGQAEIEFEDGSLARLTPNSSLALAHLTVDGGGNFDTQLVLANGLAYFELRAAQRFAYTVAAGADRIMPVENTTFRVSLDEAPATVAVLDGTAHVERAGSYATDVRTGESFRADAEGAGRYFLIQQIAPDSWDQWNESRDQMAADESSQNTSARDGYAGNQGYGWSDLDANGRWYDVAGQGEVWQPVGGDAAGFDPYGNGSWVWYPGAGYVWASGYAWGWTPFRCGGWSYWDTFGWGWTPNYACAGFGFGGGYGYGGYFGYPGRLNILLPPLHYTGHLPPPRHGGPHPIIAVHESSPAVHGVSSAERAIAGVRATPLHVAGSSYTSRGGSAVGSSLRRDYPVDRTTHTAILGVQPGQGTARQGFVSGGQPGYGSRYAPGTQRAMPSGARPGGYAVPGAYPRSTMQSAPRPAPSYAAPRMAAPSYSAPSAPASHVAAPSGGGGKK